ncbi:MAG: hypothetical protein ILN61_06185, partial [Lachnospiraceae bacterium]|nr:hypothetical protein [Lachnospiraceae bacterium]
MSSLKHYGRSIVDGAPVGSGRYHRGSGKNPKHPLGLDSIKQLQKAIKKDAVRRDMDGSNLGRSNLKATTAYKEIRDQLLSDSDYDNLKQEKKSLETITDAYRKTVSKTDKYHLMAADYAFKTFFSENE